jgi:putative ABC transport system permease protein
LALTLLAAAIAGVLPALKITRGIGERLKQTSSGRVTFGGIWTAVIITQVALTVAFPAVAFFVRRDSVQIQTLAVDFPSEQFLSVRPQLDHNSGIVPGDSSLQAYRGRVDSTLRVFEQRLLGEPGVLGVTATDRLPRSDHGWNEIEVDDGAVAPPDERGHRISSAAVDPDYFTVLDAPVLSGRGFSESDVGSEARPVIVNTVFVDRVLGGKNPLGRRIRYLRGKSPRAPKEPPGPWYDIVGVVGDLGTKNGYGLSGVYHPFQPTREDRANAYFAIRVRGEPGAFIPRVRALATAVDPTLRLHELKPLDRVIDDESRFYGFLFHMTLLVAGFTLVLSLAGVYSVMAFTVSRRTREIGIRVAMGAVPRQIIPVILRRPLRQVAFGILAGGILVWAMSNGGVKPELVLDHAVEGLDTLRGGVWIRTALLTAGYSVLMMGVCLLACIVPTRRALRVQPTEALRSDG